MKWKILILTFAIPILLASFLFLTIYFKESAFEIYITAAFLVAYIARNFLSDKRYFRSLNVTSNTLEILYYTPFLKLKSLQIPLSGSTDIELRTTKWFLWLPALDVKREGELYSFQILHRELLSKIEAALGSYQIQYKH